MAENEPSREIIAYIRERDEAKAELKKSQDELMATKSKLYDAKTRIQELEEQVCIRYICILLLSSQNGKLLYVHISSTGLS